MVLVETIKSRKIVEQLKELDYTMINREAGVYYFQSKIRRC
jgi:hypothetical protein